MFRVLFLCLAFFTLSFQSLKIPQIGSEAPSFEAQTTKGVVRFPEDYLGKWVILFSFPNVLTPVCTTEMDAWMQDYQMYQSLNCELLGLTVYSEDWNQRWMQDIQTRLASQEAFPLIADVQKKVAKEYGMIHPKTSKNKAIRAVYIIGPDNKIRAILFYPMLTGRSTQEVQRLLVALQEVEKQKGVTPANWQKGDKLLNCKKCLEGH